MILGSWSLPKQPSNPCELPFQLTSGELSENVNSEFPNSNLANFKFAAASPPCNSRAALRLSERSSRAPRLLLGAIPPGASAASQAAPNGGAALTAALGPLSSSLFYPARSALLSSSHDDCKAPESELQCNSDSRLLNHPGNSVIDTN